MAHRSSESLGQEGRYRQTPSSPGAASKGQSSSVAPAGVRQQHEDRLQQAGDTLRRLGSNGNKDNEYNVGATSK